ncbi:MAG: hypothetical protein KatS3mg102_2777 [Planctomycetota bacterium]|nr:MAG: hypothetical protein KatS3mg102_2777 [Planctomycetota bacterium]
MRTRHGSMAGLGLLGALALALAAGPWRAPAAAPAGEQARAPALAGLEHQRSRGQDARADARGQPAGAASSSTAASPGPLLAEGGAPAPAGIGVAAPGAPPAAGPAGGAAGLRARSRPAWPRTLPGRPLERERIAEIYGPAPLVASHPRVAPVIAVQQRHTPRLMAQPEVIGTAVGLDASGQIGVVVYARALLGAELPAYLEGVPVIVWQRDDIYALGRAGTRLAKARAESTDPTQRCDRPVPIGVSTGHPDITAGTIGARVTDGTRVFALSNNHVYADENRASLGDPALQPGPFDGGQSPQDDIGWLFDYEPIVFGGPPFSGRNKIDAAIAESSSSLLAVATPADGYGVPGTVPVDPALTLRVQKYGRTTALTFGEITAINATVVVQYDSGRASFSEQIVIEPGSFSAGGDSGSLIVTADQARQPVGLLFAGSSTDTIANPIGRVLERFGVAIDDRDEPPPALSSIEVSPVSAEIAKGQTQQFTATGIYSDGSTADLTGQATWSSSDESVATVDASGLATGVAAGTAAITAAVQGLADSASLTVTDPDAAATVRVANIAYATTGGRNNKRHLSVTVKLVDHSGTPVAGASVTVRIDHDGGSSRTGTGTTGTDGTVTFVWNNAPAGCYVTTVTDVSAAGSSWDPNDPANTSAPFCK